MASLPRAAAVAALLVAVITGCAASGGTPNCADGVDRGLLSTGSCGPDVTVTVKSGSSCLPSAFTGFNSELAGFPAGTNNDHPIETLLEMGDGGFQTRRCVLAAIRDSGFVVDCDLCAPDGGALDGGGCLKIGTCQSSLLP